MVSHLLPLFKFLSSSEASRRLPITSKMPSIIKMRLHRAIPTSRKPQLMTRSQSFNLGSQTILYHLVMFSVVSLWCLVFPKFRFLMGKFFQKNLLEIKRDLKIKFLQKQTRETEILFRGRIRHTYYMYHTKQVC